MVGSKRKQRSKKRSSSNKREKPVQNATAAADDDTELQKEATRAALILCSMKHDKLESEIANKLQQRRRERGLDKSKFEDNSSAKGQPKQPGREEGFKRDKMEQSQQAQYKISRPTDLEIPQLGYSIDGNKLPTLPSMKHDKLESEIVNKLQQRRRERVLDKSKIEDNSSAKGQPKQPGEEEGLKRDKMEQSQPAQYKIRQPTDLELPHPGYSIDGNKLPTSVKREILQTGSCSWPFEKQLTQTDVNGGQHSGLSFHNDVIREAIVPFFGRDYKKLDVSDGISVTVYDSNGREYEMVFKRWKWKNPESYVLTRGWKEFCDANGLKEHQDWVSVWMFRHKITEKLCFVLTFKRFPIFSLTEKKSSKAKGIKIKGCRLQIPNK